MHSGQSRGSELHSPLSPLSPGSPIHPDGVFSPLWFVKHQQQVPAVFLAFFELRTGDDSSHNEQVQIDINAIKVAISRSGFKTKLAVLLLSDRSILQAPELEEHLSAIRRATALDPKTGLFFMPPMSSQAEISTFVHTMLATLQPSCVEYYRDLTKHARRKKGRGAPAPNLASPVSGASQSLSTPGWNVRYEVKQGVFAEFRQEMDVAERHYSAAIEELFNAEGIFEATASWSPRWDEGRLLCDALALRVIRCQLWNSITIGAVSSWVNYRARMKDLVDRRGKGSETYGWAAWESRWAEMMAQLIRRSQVPSLEADVRDTAEGSGELLPPKIYASPEPALVSTERLPPFHMMHHPGYWFRLAVHAARRRRQLALAIPEEDRSPPGQSPASAIAHRVPSYDLYLVPDPHEEYPLHGTEGYDHLSAISRLTEAAVSEFDARGQLRSSARLKLDLSRDLCDSQRHAHASELLQTLWTEGTWRDDTWVDLFAELLLLLEYSARRQIDPELVLASSWELLALGPKAHPARVTSLEDCFEGLSMGTGKVSLDMNREERLSPISIAFAFGSHKTNVGEALQCQVALTCTAAPTADPLSLQGVEIVLSNGAHIKMVHQRGGHDGSASQQVTVSDLSDSPEAIDNDSVLHADLTIWPGKERAYNFLVHFREAIAVHLQHISIMVESPSFTLRQSFPNDRVRKLSCFNEASAGGVEQRWLPQMDTHTVTVLPKPPKMKVLMSGLRKHYYTDETIKFDVELFNEESDAVTGKAHASLTGENGESVPLEWSDSNSRSNELDVDELSPGASRRACFILQAPPDPAKHSLVCDVQYELVSDPNTSLMQRLDVAIDFVSPFDITFDFSPMTFPGAWPSYFNTSAINPEGQASGIPQRWRLGCLIKSLARDDVTVHNVSVIEDDSPSEARCEISSPDSTQAQMLKTGHSMESDVELTTQKLSLDDRRPTVLELSVKITWSLHAGSETASTLLPVPRLTLPSSEPRVLCTIAEGLDDNETLTMQYHLENPSTHFLTFALTMEANELFALSGPKYRTLSLAPLSRHHVEYRLLVHDVDATEKVGNEHWIWPVLQVVDSYYHKNLKVHSGGPGVKFDEKRGIGIKLDSRR